MSARHLTGARHFNGCQASLAGPEPESIGNGRLATVFMKRIAVVGAGTWGTALALILNRLGHEVKLWARRPELAEQIRQTRENKPYLPGVELPNEIAIANSMAVIEDTEIVLSVVPSHSVREIYRFMLPHVDARMVFVSATKGIETNSLMRMSQVITDVLAPKFKPRIVVLSGPSFALEVVKGHPTAIVAASKDNSLARMVQREMSGKNLRLYTNTDVVGVEIGGAVKNIVAIAAGVIHGLGFGYNTLAGLITRGLAEMGRLAAAVGGRQETLAGLAGLGDLVLTCAGPLSRNRGVGIQLAQGRRLEEILRATSMVAEGVKTTKSTLELARKLSVQMPITEQMHRVMYEGKYPKLAIQELMERELKEE